LNVCFTIGEIPGSAGDARERTPFTGCNVVNLVLRVVESLLSLLHAPRVIFRRRGPEGARLSKCRARKPLLDTLVLRFLVHLL
jgi:hypothetical protein